MADAAPTTPDTFQSQRRARQLEAARRDLMDIIAEYGDPELDRTYEVIPEGLLDFVRTCHRLGDAHITHPPEEQDLLRQSNELEARLGIPRMVSHEIRRHFAA